MSAYFNRYAQYQSITKDTTQQKTTREDMEQNKWRELLNKEAINSSEEISSFLFSTFLSAVTSYNNKLSYFKQAFPNANNGELSSLLASVKINNPDKIKGINFATIELTANTAIAAQQQLNDLLAYINLVAHNKVLDSLNSEIQTKLKTLKLSKERIKSFTDTSQSIRLKNLHKALLIAQHAGIKHYTTSYNSQFLVPNSASGEADIKLEDDKLAENNFLFLLGEDYLKAQIDTLNSYPIVYPEQYYHIEQQIKQLTTLLDEQNNVAFDVFSYQSSPNLPLQRTAPKRTMIVIVGTLLGGVIGVLLALFLGALASRRNRLNLS